VRATSDDVIDGDFHDLRGERRIDVGLLAVDSAGPGWVVGQDRGPLREVVQLAEKGARHLENGALSACRHPFPDAAPLGSFAPA